MMQRPSEHLAEIARRYPQAWKLADKMRADRGTALPDWPGWCFLPMGGWYAVISVHTRQQHLPPNLVPDVAKLAALGAWRATQGIYRFHDAVRASLLSSVVSGQIPCDVLKRLPEWCAYVETPGYTVSGTAASGFFAHLERDANSGREELRLLIDMAGGLVPVVLHIGPWTVTEAVDRAAGEAVRQASAARIPMDTPQPDDISALAGAIQPLLSLLLYLCSEGPEIEQQGGGQDRPQHPRPTRTKAGWRLFPPSSPRIWNVGDGIGKTIVLARATANQGGDRNGPSPHIRKAHWHGYWTGQRGQQRFAYRWLPPIAVAMRETDAEGDSDGDT